jgi:hypothetical protein
MAEVSEDERRRLAERVFGPGAEPTPSEIREFAALSAGASPRMLLHARQDAGDGAEIGFGPTRREVEALPRPSSSRVGLALVATACGFLGGAGLVALGGNAPDQGLPEAAVHVDAPEDPAPNPNDWALNSLVSLGAYGETDVWLALSKDRVRECMITSGADGGVTCKPAGSDQVLSSGSIAKQSHGSIVRRSFTVETSGDVRTVQASVEVFDSMDDAVAVHERFQHGPKNGV